MEITKSLWNKALLLQQETNARDEILSRKTISEILEVSDRTAYGLHFALENKQILQFQPVSFCDIKTELLICDLHIPFHDKLAIESIFEFIEEEKIKIDTIVILGDLIDCFKISRYERNKQRRNLKYEIDIARQFLIDLRNRFPDQKIIFYKGNHEERIDKYILRNAEEIWALVSDLLENKLTLKDLNIEHVEDYFKIGQLWHLHGHEKTGGSYNPEYITNVIWNYTYDHTIFAHFHRTQKKIFKRIDGKYFHVSGTGYLAKELDWARLNKWNQGFAIIKYDNIGQFRARQYEIVNGNIF